MWKVRIKDRIVYRSPAIKKILNFAYDSVFMSSFGYLQAQMVSMAVTLLTWAYWRCVDLSSILEIDILFNKNVGLQVVLHECLRLVLRGVRVQNTKVGLLYHRNL